MGRSREEQLAAWTTETRRVGFKRRNWPVVRRLAALCTGLLLAGLAARLQGYAPVLAAACWITAAVAGAVMLIWFFDPRRFRARPSGTS
ncbi:hypothetical protein [Sphingomonas sanguinis]|jgi:hypothetical protein|uniref:Uncharacterized protein n=1 Tax=Sphingomonas sanguinis TaxID=33051 RepID=A0A7Y7QYG8_9SPHN|nr:hypothetical protein [Sphingomonas sanguinis]MBZ6383778.1 hypothetical protein [Sphingomonas sanguinis]NNG49699.1 hypothetical protein [Sphingomonas sanguinis]NNG52774.1 hypothetical protein [Sphingomonas sanguinis]NVP33069.1 hypothetical protein [Sphingomonas sanguinis]